MLSIAFSYSRCSTGMEKITGSGMKISLTLTSLANKFFIDMRDRNDEAINTGNEEDLRHFVRRCTKRGLCCALYHCSESDNSDKLFDNILEELNIIGDVCTIIDNFFWNCRWKYENVRERLWFSTCWVQRYQSRRKDEKRTR